MRGRALVTGGSAGLGAALVAALAARGYSVTSVDRHAPPTELDGVTYRRADLGEIDAMRELGEALAGPLFDVVIHSAGISAVGAFETIAPESLQKVIDVNLRAPIVLTHMLLARQAIAPLGSLVFIASLSNRLGYPGASVYAATKQGLESFARSLRRSRRQSVLCVYPGPLRTAHARRYAPREAAEDRRMAPERLAVRILSRLGRSGDLYGDVPQHFAGVVGLMLPGITTALMRRALYQKLAETPPAVDEPN